MGILASEIRRLLNQREAARNVRDWNTADSIKSSLRGLGVTVNDAEKRWSTTDGREGVIGAEEASTEVVSEVEINNMLAKREDARNARDWVVADEIKNFLRQNGVQVWDKEK